LRLTPRGMKTIENNGGIDAYLLGTNDSKLSPEMTVLKRRVVAAKAKKDAKAAVAA
jgi:large subunit ribosomal protein L28